MNACNAFPRRAVKPWLNLLCVTGLAMSQTAAATDVPAANVAATGTLGIAEHADNSAVSANPGALGLTERYDIQGMFRYGPSKDMRWNVSAADASTNSFLSFGFAYNGGVTQPDFLPEELPGWEVTGTEPVNTKSTHDLTFALATPFLDRRMSMGLNGTLSIFDNAILGKGTTGNMDFGIAGQPIEALTIGLVARNVLPVAEQYDRPASLGLGVRGGLEGTISGVAEIDYRFEHVQQSALDVRFGAEAGWRALRLRAGTGWSGDTDSWSFSWGIGGRNDTGSLDYAMWIPLSDLQGLGDITHGLSITLVTGGLKKKDDLPR